MPQSGAVTNVQGLVSIGLPVFNGADFLTEAVSSILAQSYQNFELIICDNASTDGTEDICRAFAAADKRVRYLRSPRNEGAAANYNRAFHEAHGEFFKWASHDDILAPDFLRVCVRALEEERTCVLAHCGTVLINEDGDETGCYIDCLASSDADPIARFRTWMRQPRGQCNPVFGVIRRNVMEKTILHGTYIGADRVLLGEFALRGKVKMVPKGYFFRRIHQDMSTVANKNALRLTDWFQGGKARGLRFKRWRMLREFLLMIWGIDSLSYRQKIAAHKVVFLWSIALRSEFIKELLLPLYINGEDTRLKTWLRQRSSRRNSSKKRPAARI